jgi:hypothetical protein
MRYFITLFSCLFLSIFSFAQIGLPIQPALLPKNNLVVNYDFSKSSSFTRGATTVSNIASTASGNASIVNAPIFFNSLGFVSFNGTNQYVVTPNVRTYFKSLDASIQKSFTMSFWVYPTAASGNLIYELDSQTPNSGWNASNIELVNGSVKYRIWNGSAITSMTTVNLNQWHHLAMVYDGASIKGYLNGVLQGTQTYARIIPTNGQFYAIGAGGDQNLGTSAYGSFNLAQFKLFNLPMSDKEIAQEYNARKSEFDYTIHSPSTNSSPTYWSISSAWNNSTGSTGTSDAFGIYHYTPWLNSALGWAAQTLDANQYITLNYDEPAYVNGVVIQPRATSGNQFVTKVHVETSLTGAAPWTRVLSDQPISTTITDDARILFPKSVFTKAVKVIPVTWTNHITMRMGMLVKPNKPVTDGLVLRLDPANIKSYQGSGTSFKDLTTNLSDFTLVGTPAFNVNGFFTFNGTNQYASRINTSSLKPTTAISIEQWLNADNWNAGTSNTNYKCSLSCTEGGGYSHNIWDGNFYSYIYAGGTYLIPSASVSNFSGWHHFVTTFDGRYAKLYIDSELANTVDYGSSNKTMSYASNSIFLGAEAGASTSPTGSFWQGKIANTSIYNKALSDLEVLQNFNSSKYLFNVVEFKSVGSTTWTVPADVNAIEYLVVGGGGGGANGYDNAGGGGGGGGMVLTGELAVTPGSLLNIIVGDGGVGGVNSRLNNAGTAGNNSIFHTITALGGGGGFGSRTTATAGASQIGSNSAPGGGGGSQGGNGGKGGGGSTGSGTSNSGTIGGAGGAGFTSIILGISMEYGTGGAGANSGTQNAGVNGAINTGNGGKAGGAASSSSTAGGNGGSGVVILKLKYN